MAISGVKGFNDILPGEVEKWQHIEMVARRVFELYGFAEIRVPILEKTELFARSIGDATDIVEKEMYSFEDKGQNRVTMRPEGTAGVMRANGPPSGSKSPSRKRIESTSSSACPNWSLILSSTGFLACLCIMTASLVPANTDGPSE